MTSPLHDASLEFSRERLAGYTPEILESKILLVGCGALGAALASLLAMWGFRDVILVDPDTYERSNATRTLDFPWKKVLAGRGVPKATEVARQWRRRLHAAGIQSRVRSVVGYLQELPGREWAGCDVVLSAVDHPRARHDAMLLARTHGKPLISGGFDGRSGEWSAAYVGATAEACASCLFEDTPVYAAGDVSCASFGRRELEAWKIPATPTLATVVAGAMVHVLAEVLMHRIPTDIARVLKAANQAPWASPGPGELGTGYDIGVNAGCEHCSLPHGPALASVRGRTLGALLGSLRRKGLRPHIHLPFPLVVNTLDANLSLVRTCSPPWRIPTTLSNHSYAMADQIQGPIVLREVDDVLLRHFAIGRVQTAGLGLGAGARCFGMDMLGARVVVQIE